MLSEGYKLLSLLETAQNNIVLCAPFIKRNVLKKLLMNVPTSVSVKVVTRWRPQEVACGVSDLEVYDLIFEMDNVRLYLLDSLHAKLYVADEACLVGSANLTGTALGWSTQPNVELLVPSDINDEDIQFLLTQIQFAREASEVERDRVAGEAQSLNSGIYEEDIALSDESFELWLPSCASPSKLYGIYTEPEAEKWVAESVKSALSDLEVLATPAGLTVDEFASYISMTLERMPAFKKVLDKIPRGIRDADGITIIKELRSGYDRIDAQKHWEIIQDWIRCFFADKYEVVPDSYLVRLKH